MKNNPIKIRQEDINIRSAFQVQPTSILTSLRGGQRDERLDVVVRQSGEDSSANQPT